MLFRSRELTPNDYGIIAILTIFFSLCNTFIDSGFSTALIRKINRTETDNSTVFYYNILVGLLVSIILFTLSPYIAEFFDIPILTSVTKVLSFTVFINSLCGVHQALLVANIDFKTQAKISLLSTIISGIIGIWAAYNGYGVWALVWQLISLSILKTGLMWALVKWKPTKSFSKSSFKELFGFGSKLLASSVLDVLYTNAYTLVIGKIFSPASLGFYSRASQFAQFPSSNITGIIQRVTFPVLSTLQNDDSRLSLNYRKLLRVSAFTVFPLMMGLAALALPLIEVTLTEKWTQSAIYLQIMCFSMMWHPIHAINLNLLQVKGRSDLFLKLEILKKGIGITILCITVPMGLIAMCYGQIVSSLIALVINTHYTGKLINVGYTKQMKDITPALLASLIMGSIVYGSTILINTFTMQLIVGILLGLLIYPTIAYVFKFKEIQYIKELIKK